MLDRPLHRPLRETWNIVKLGDIERDSAAYVFAILLDQLLKLVLPSASENKLGPGIDETGGKGFSDSTGRADDKNFLIRPRHFGCFLKLRKEVKGNHWGKIQGKKDIMNDELR